jgi:hypothetical protein
MNESIMSRVIAALVFKELAEDSSNSPENSQKYYMMFLSCIDSIKDEVFNNSELNDVYSAAMIQIKEEINNNGN